MAEPEDADLQPLDVDGVGAVATGTAVWAVLTIVTVVLHGRLEQDGRGWWTWVCVVGMLLGLLALPFLLRRTSRVHRRLHDDTPKTGPKTRANTGERPETRANTGEPGYGGRASRG